MVATDEQGLRGTLDVTVTVTELNEGPVVSGTATFTINEYQDLSNASYTARDPEATGGGTTTIRWSTSGRGRGDFTIDRGAGVLTFRTPPDYERAADSNRENVYEVTVRAYDGRNYGDFEVTVTVLAVNEGPEITGRDTFSYRENGTSALYTYRASDPEGDEFTWGLGGLDASKLEINEQGVLTFASPPDFDDPTGSGADGNQYLVTVQARDDQGNTAELPLTVTVTDQNEGAVIVGQETIGVRKTGIRRLPWPLTPQLTRRASPLPVGPSPAVTVAILPSMGTANLPSATRPTSTAPPTPTGTMSTGSPYAPTTDAPTAAWTSQLR